MLNPKNSFRKVWMVRRKSIPLHPLSPQNGVGGIRNFLSSERRKSLLFIPSREGNQGREALKRSLKDLHRQIRSTRSEYSFEYLGKRTVIILYNKVFLDSMTGKAFWDRDTSQVYLGYPRYFWTTIQIIQWRV